MPRLSSFIHPTRDTTHEAHRDAAAKEVRDLFAAAGISAEVTILQDSENGRLRIDTDAAIEAVKDALRHCLRVRMPSEDRGDTVHTLGIIESAPEEID